nr:hypothetical protein [Pseudomonas sp. RW407]
MSFTLSILLYSLVPEGYETGFNKSGMDRGVKPPKHDIPCSGP